MGYYKHTSHYTLKMISEGHLWQDLYPTLCVDSNHTKEPPSKATDGYITNLEGDLGSHFPQSWSAKLQQVVTTNSGESESIAWSGGAKQLVKLGAIFEKPILGVAKVYCYNDNEAARISFMHGASKRMSHVGRHAGVRFDFIREAGLIPKHLSGVSNVGDIFTKVLIAKLIRRIFGLGHPMIGGMKAATREMMPHQQLPA